MNKKIISLFLVALASTSSTVQASMTRLTTPLHEAAQRGFDDSLTYLIKQCPDYLNTQDSSGFTPLHHAAAEGHPACVTILLNAHANINATHNAGKTPLHFAAEYGRTECVILLLAHPDINELAIDDYGWTPLHFAAARGYVDCVKALAAKNSTTNAINFGEWTPLHAAVKNRHVDCINFLLEQGADIADTPDLATEKGFLDLAQYLKEQAQKRLENQK